MKVYESDYGIIEYRFPTVPEAMVLFGKMGVNPGSVLDPESEETEELILMGKMIKNMKPFIKKIELEANDGEKVESFESAITRFEFMEPLTNVAAEILKSLEVSKK